MLGDRDPHFPLLVAFPIGRDRRSKTMAKAYLAITEGIGDEDPKILEVPGIRNNSYKTQLSCS